jgi:hypothetical protein
MVQASVMVTVLLVILCMAAAGLSTTSGNLLEAESWYCISRTAMLVL